MAPQVVEVIDYFETWYHAQNIASLLGNVVSALYGIVDGMPGVIGRYCSMEAYRIELFLQILASLLACCTEEVERARKERGGGQASDSGS